MNESDKSPSTPPLSGSDYLADIIKSISSGETIRKENAPQEGNPTQDVFSSLLSNPELLSKLPNIIATVKPIMEMLGAASAASTPASAPPISHSLQNSGNSLALSSKSQESRGDDHRTALLCALKPYLGADRRQAIDYIIKLDRLGDVLKTL